MAKKLNDKSEVPQNLTALYALIPKGMAELYAAEQDVARLMDTYVNEAKDRVKKLKRTIKADTGLETKDFDNFYRIHKRIEEAKSLEDDDRDRIIDTNRIIFTAMKKGGQLDLLTASAEAKAAQSAGNDDIGAGYETGKEAGLEGKNQDANPFDEGSEPFKNWNDGWMAAQKQRAAELGNGKAKAAKEAKGAKPKKSGAAKRTAKGPAEAHA